MRLMINDQGGEGRNLAFNTEADRQFSSKFHIQNTAAVILTLKLVGFAVQILSPAGWFSSKYFNRGVAREESRRLGAEVSRYRGQSYTRWVYCYYGRALLWWYWDGNLCSRYIVLLLLSSRKSFGFLQEHGRTVSHA